MEMHHLILRSLCRLCGTKFKEHKLEKSRIVSKLDFKNDIQKCFSIDLEEDRDGVHPNSICYNCKLKLTRWRKMKNKAKTADIHIEMCEFSVHDDAGCSICENNQWDPAAIMKICQEKGVNSWIRGAKVIAVWHDGMGERVVKRIVFEDGEYNVFIIGRRVDFSSYSVREVLDRVSAVNICPGNINFGSLAQQNPGGFKGKDGSTVAVVEEDYFDGDLIIREPSVRHVKCAVVSSESVLCPVCATYKGSLHVKETRRDEQKRNEQKEQSKFTRNDYLTKEELLEKVKFISKEMRIISSRNVLYKAKIAEVLRNEVFDVAEGDADVIDNLVEDCSSELDRLLPTDSHARLLWEEQLKARRMGLKQMRYHPALIKWAIAIHSKSSSAYSVLRNSGYIRLPHPSTLYNYVHFTDPCTGLNPKLLNNFMKVYNIGERPLHERFINLLFDEMKVKSGLAFSERTGRIIGFVDVGDITTEILKFERHCIDKPESPEIASHALLFMARGICSKMKFPVAYYGTQNLTASQIYPIAIECVEALRYMGLHVKCLTSDGASINRKLYNIIAGESETSTPKHKSKNCFTEDGNLFFICDTPHLIKTVRNNFENSQWHKKTRNLVYKKKSIAWPQLLRLYEWDQGRHRTMPGLQLLPKLTYEHLHLTPSLRMKVKLAVQVMSSSVANALETMKKPELESTIHFICMFNKCFDCLNVSTLLGWQKKHNENLKPYTSIDDVRLEWLVKDFLGFLSEWQAEIAGAVGVSKKERQRLYISRVTSEGFHITVNSFVEITKELLEVEGVTFVLSDKFNQDPIEEFFGKQRGAGGFHDNPTIEQFGHHMLKNVVAGTSSFGSSRGNVTVSQPSKTEVSDEPLPKRKRSSNIT